MVCMKNLRQYLEGQGVDGKLTTLILALADGVKEIAEVIKSDKGEKVGSENVFGEAQITMDVKSNQIINDLLVATGVVGLVASEEMDDEEKIGDGEYAVAHDPLDGSSLVDVNLAVGSIFGVYKTGTFYGKNGGDQVAAMLGVYGPRTAIFFTVRKGTAYFVLNVEGEFILQKEELKISEKAKIFAPGNLRACSERDDYVELVNYWMKNQYQLRYSGGMVPDIGQIILKGEGIFAYPGYGEQPHGKLRTLYECAPMALIVEEAGGAASDGVGRILDQEIKDLAQRTPIFIGSSEEVERCKKFLS